MKAAPKLSDERVRQILAYACTQRDGGTLFVTVMASELEALAQEAVDKRTALLVLNARLDELEQQIDAAANIIARFAGEGATPGWLRDVSGFKNRREVLAAVSKSSTENDRADAGEIVHAPGPSRK